MRRILLTLMVGAALVALVPATALAAKHHSKAHHHARHHASHHARHHARRHSRVRFERFGTAPGSDASSQSNSSTEPGQENEQNAGTVASFQNGTLTIMLNDGSTVSGKVTPDTEIECRAEDTSSTMQRDDEGRDHSDRGDDNDNDNGDENGEEDHNEQSCSSADLQPGTAVREAELKVSGSGASWDKVELVTSQTSAGAGEDEGADD
jgi:hypothetical protein